MNQNIASIYLLHRSLTDSEVQTWDLLITFVREVFCIPLSIKCIDKFDFQKYRDYVYLTESTNLTYKLLTQFKTIFIEPTSAPTKVDLFLYLKLLPSLESAFGSDLSLEPWKPKTSILTSVYNGDEYLTGFLDNASKLEEYHSFQHFLFRPNSPGNEHVQLLEHVRSFPNAVYISLSQDPGLYDVWNLGARLSTSPYLTNANIDDRRAPTQLKTLIEVLDKDPSVDVASTSLRVTSTKNQTWADSSDNPIMFTDFSSEILEGEQLLKKTNQGYQPRNFPHCMPVWRKRLHAENGYFREKIHGPSSDWAFWLRVGKDNGRFFHSSKPLGLYLKNPNSYWRKSQEIALYEKRILREHFNQISKPYPLALELNEVVKSFSCGAPYEALQRVVNLFEVFKKTDGLSFTWISRLFNKEFGVVDFFEICQSHTFYPDNSKTNGEPLKQLIVELIHRVDFTNLTESRKNRVTNNFELLVVNYSECYHDSTILYALAFLYFKKNDLVGEKALLRHFYATSKVDFWKNIQNYYRFTRSVSNINSLLNSEVSNHVPLDTKIPFKLNYFPAYKGNAYLQLLYQKVNEAGISVQGFDSEYSLFTSVKPDSRERIIHIHWVNRLFDPQHFKKNPDAVEPSLFLKGIKELKQQNNKIYWTIHNAISHDAKFPKKERAFRRELYDLSDKVFIHHPLAIQFLDWLPDTKKLFLLEHGPYPVPPATSKERNSIRANLGLSPTDIVVTHLGRIKDYKGLEQTLPILHTSCSNIPNLKVILAGKISSVELSKNIQSSYSNIIVNDYELTDQQFNEFMIASDYGFLSYSQILTSGTLFHWLSNNRPVIAPLLGTIPGYVVNGWNGYLYEQPEDLVQILSHLANFNPQSKMIENAKQTAQTLVWNF